MKQLFLILAILFICFYSTAQTFSESAALQKAKKLGISSIDVPGFIQMEKQRFENKSPDPNTKFNGAYSNLIKPANSLRVNNNSLCNNLDFEDYNYGNWTVFTGSNTNSFNPPANVAIDPLPITTGMNWNGNHALLDSANSFEPGSNISLLSNYPGKIMARINQVLVPGATVGIIERQITITSNQPYLNFSYAAFLENAGHTAADQPYIRIKLIDNNNVSVPGASLSIVADSGSVNAGFTLVNNNGASFFYKPWTPVTIDLSAYIGQTLTFQMTAASCAMSGHNGHAYLDFDCGGPLAGVPSVWPGDANYDLAVDYLDLFYVGSGFGLNGTSRAIQGNNWAATTSNNWNANSLYLVDAKHADCDGNGQVGFSDTTAILLNYGFTHAFKSSGVHLVAESNDQRKTISIQSSQNTIQAGQPFSLQFNLGNSSELIDSIYAIGFTMDYPDQMLDNSQSSLNCNNSMLEGTNNTISLFKPTTGTADLAITKTNHISSANFQGEIFSLDLRAATVIATDATFNLTLSNMKAITRMGNQIPLTSLPLQLDFKTSDATGLLSFEPSEFSIFPNPASDKVSIRLAGGSELVQYEIFSLLGEMVRSENQLKTGTLDVDVSNLNDGSYILSLRLSNGQTLNKNFLKY